MTIEELKVRLALCRAAIRELEASDDPRAEDAIRHYRTQEAELVRQMEALKPPDVVVAMGAVELFAGTKE